MTLRTAVALSLAMPSCGLLTRAKAKNAAGRRPDCPAYSGTARPGIVWMPIRIDEPVVAALAIWGLRAARGRGAACNIGGYRILPC